jgi:steroid 5-alpha reductase family enzyme
MSIWLIVLFCLGICCMIMTAVWYWAKKINNAGVVDVFWAFNFPVIALILFFLADGLPLRKLFICGMVTLAGLRLGIHLWQRVIGHLTEEEGRYKQLRREWAPNENLKFFWFFQFQAISNVILAAPFFLITSNPKPEMHWLEYTGIVLWGIAIIGEAIADRQLAFFKKDPKNKAEVCDFGLWHYSRHPNYFFQCLMWVAYFLFALTAPWGWMAIISPLIIIHLILNVTGISATEEQSLRSKGDQYRHYQQTTSPLIPWFKKK